MRLQYKLLPVIAFSIMTLGSAHAFADDEARKALLELRMQVETQRLAVDDLIQQQADSIMELSAQLELLRQEVAQLRGEAEELKVLTDEIHAQTAPKKVTFDGRTFNAMPPEIADYETAMETLRKGDFSKATSLFEAFIARWPNSGYQDSAAFWLGNALYVEARYQESVDVHLKLIQQSPNHVRTPEAMLSVANAYLQLNQKKQMTEMLQRLIREYPDSKAAEEAKKSL